MIAIIPRALEVFRDFEGKSLPQLLLTTDHVVFETVTFFVKKVSHERAVYVGERLYRENLASIYRTSFDEQMAAFEYLKRHHDKEYSAVDCLSFVVMEKHGIREALAVDETETPRTPLGRRLRDLREAILADGTPTLGWEGIAEEVATRRGGWREPR